MCTLKVIKILKRNLDRFGAKLKEFWISKTLSHTIRNPNLFPFLFDPNHLPCKKEERKPFVNVGETWERAFVKQNKRRLALNERRSEGTRLNSSHSGESRMPSSA